MRSQFRSPDEDPGADVVFQRNKTTLLILVFTGEISTKRYNNLLWCYKVGRTEHVKSPCGSVEMANHPHTKHC